MYTTLKEDGNYLNNGQGTYMEFVVDNIEDVATLPTGIGDASIALVCNAATVYVLNNAREWVVLIAG